MLIPAITSAAGACKCKSRARLVVKDGREDEDDNDDEDEDDDDEEREKEEEAMMIMFSSNPLIGFRFRCSAELRKKSLRIVERVCSQCIKRARKRERDRESR